MTDRTYRVTEIVGTSPTSIDAAIRNGLQRAGQTLRHLDWFEVTEIRGQLEGGADRAHPGRDEGRLPGSKTPEPAATGFCDTDCREGPCTGGSR